ncbi:glycoside hydrolase family 61 protein [Xylariaceae sp. FL0662B]|nr:glycoside hydrolase family 61 protein [Xylariaceae sp. FL0662B]
MKHFYFGLLGLEALFFTTLEAHTVFTTLFVDNVSQGDGTCVRMNMNPQHCTDPISSLSSDDMACGVSGQQPVAFTCPAPAGAKLTFQWRTWADAEQPGSIDPSHKGPCAVYAKQVKDMATDSAAGPGWVKLWDEGYDDATGQWCTEKLIANDGLLSFAIPAGLPAGPWLFRPELLALHNADKGDPQFYVGCAQVSINSSSGNNDVPAPASATVSIPGHVAPDDPGLTFNIYAPQFPYPMPGPAVYDFPPAPASENVHVAATAAAKVKAPPADYIVKNANWVGVEVAAYTTEDGCWAASSDCWDQAQACYDSAPPSGSENCALWEGKCQGIEDACAAGDFVGPPDRGQKLGSKEPASPGSIPEAANVAVAAAADGSSRRGRSRKRL